MTAIAEGPAIAFDMRKRGKSIDAPLGSGSSDENGDSRPRTLGDSLATPLFGRLPLRTQVDLLLVKEHLTKREWEVFFEMRYARYMEHTDIARAFGWTESRYRWFWGKLKKKLMVLTDHRRHPCARQH